MYICSYVRTYVCVHLHTCMIRQCSQRGAYPPLYAGMYICVYVCMYVCMYVYIYVCVYDTMMFAARSSPTTFTLVCTCMHVHIYVCIYINICVERERARVRARERANAVERCHTFSPEQFSNVFIHFNV